MIRVQFVLQADNLSSQMIAWFSQGHFSHVDAVLPDGRLLGARANRVGGQPPGVQIRPPGYAKFASRVVMGIPCTAVQEKVYYDFLYKQLGKPYDKEAILGFVFGRDWREPDSWICSEVQAAAGETSKIMPPLYLATDKITPVAYALVVSAIGGTVLESEDAHGVVRRLAPLKVR